jgi:hypothetical protein
MPSPGRWSLLILKVAVIALSLVNRRQQLLYPPTGEISAACTSARYLLANAR